MLKTENEYSAATNGWGGGVICEACERSPAVFICKADAASLCAACDAEIHSANPLARRHHRVPITRVATLVPTLEDEVEEENEEDEAASWLLMNPLKTNVNNTSRSSNNHNNNNNNNGLFLLGAEVEEDDSYLNFVEFNDDHQYEGLKNYGGGGDSVVPIEFEGKDVNHHHHYQMLQQEQSYGSELFHSSSSKACYAYNAFLPHPVSFLPLSLSLLNHFHLHVPFQFPSPLFLFYSLTFKRFSFLRFF